MNHDDEFSHHHKTNDGYRAIFYRPQSSHRRLREYLVVTDISQHLERFIQRDEKRNRADVRICQKRIVEIDLVERRVRVPAFDVRFPKQQRQRADADERNDYLKKYYRASLHKTHDAVLISAYEVGRGVPTAPLFAATANCFRNRINYSHPDRIIIACQYIIIVFR